MYFYRAGASMWRTCVCVCVHMCEQGSRRFAHAVHEGEAKY